DPTLAEPPSSTAATPAVEESRPVMPDSPPSLSPGIEDVSEVVETSFESNDGKLDTDAGARPAVDHHALLTQRLAALTQERTSRWRHVLNVFSRRGDQQGNE